MSSRVPGRRTSALPATTVPAEVRHGSQVWAFLAISTLYSVMLVTLLADDIRGAAG